MHQKKKEKRIRSTRRDEFCDDFYFLSLFALVEPWFFDEHPLFVVFFSPRTRMGFASKEYHYYEEYDSFYSWKKKEFDGGGFVCFVQSSSSSSDDDARKKLLSKEEDNFERDTCNGEWFKRDQRSEEYSLEEKTARGWFECNDRRKKLFFFAARRTTNDERRGRGRGRGDVC